jgi:hypothetical protein
MKHIFNLLILLIVSWSVGYTQDLNSDDNYIPTDFPADYVVVEEWINCTKGKYVFKSNNDFIFIHDCIGDSEIYDLGKWERKGDNLVILVTQTIGTRPIGEPTNPEYRSAAVPEEYLIYETYVNFETWEQKETIIKINDFLHSMCSISDKEKASQIEINTDKYIIPGDFKSVSCKVLSENDIKTYSKSDLRLMRNEIFARYGYRFKSDDLRLHFTNKDWYSPKRDNADEFLTDIERKNIDLIKRLERQCRVGKGESHP